MHEMSLAGGIVQLVEAAAQREQFQKVTLLRLEAGRLSGIELRALRFALDAVSPGTCLEGARFEFDEPPGTAWCLHCNCSVEITDRTDACPQCAGFRLQPTGGTDLRVIDMLVQD
jgi:hydrogenase nickel incorporation protein HypA/HybF